jgi:hypothetical protein
MMEAVVVDMRRRRSTFFDKMSNDTRDLAKTHVLAKETPWDDPQQTS